MTSLSRMLVMEEGLDMSMGHHETRDSGRALDHPGRGRPDR